jgi:hypothetical protein
MKTESDTTTHTDDRTPRHTDAMGLAQSAVHNFLRIWDAGKFAIFQVPVEDERGLVSTSLDYSAYEWDDDHGPRPPRVVAIDYVSKGGLDLTLTLSDGSTRFEPAHAFVGAAGFALRSAPPYESNEEGGEG